MSSDEGIVYDLEDDLPAVCMTHGRFVPCRRRTEKCETTTDPIKVAAVRFYQAGLSESWLPPESFS